MKNKIALGIDRVREDQNIRKIIVGDVALLCHGASVDSSLTNSVLIFKDIFKERFKKIFGPQHGFCADVQDNMVESRDFIHPYFKMIVHSLYSETRIPTPQMLEGINTIVVDLQDVGTRIYTYIYTLTLLMEACGKLGIKVVVLDRPNPINGIDIEGNILEKEFTSFVGLHPIPVRHALTIGEVGLMAKNFWKIECDYEVIPMKGWKRSMSFEDCNVPWVIPSPNLPTVDSSYTFPATVLYEGTNISEGRGTTRSLEILGHPKIEPFSLVSKLNLLIAKEQLSGFTLRPLNFMPTFQKHANTPCGGFQIHVTDRKRFQPWRVGQFLMRELFKELGSDFQWKQPPYEYEYIKMPIDLINGTDKLRHWVESNGDMQELDILENTNMGNYLNNREEILIYRK